MKAKRRERRGAKRENRIPVEIPPGVQPSQDHLAALAASGLVPTSQGVPIVPSPAPTASASMPPSAMTPTLVPAASTNPVKLDLACGQSTREGFDGVDITAAPGVKHVVNLWQFPWPWADNSVDELHCSHHVEHIPMEYVSHLHSADPSKEKPPHYGKDLFFAFFDECWRVLKHEGVMTVICPCARSNRAFQDPTHRRFIVPETFVYLDAVWRKANKLDHYSVECNFAGTATPIVLIEENARSPEAQAHRFQHLWNVILDLHVTMKANKK